MLLVNASQELGHSPLFLQTNKSNKYNVCKGLCLHENLHNLKTHFFKTTPHSQAQKNKKQKKQTSHPKIFNTIIRRFF
jgi:hypothetical protein